MLIAHLKYMIQTVGCQLVYCEPKLIRRILNLSDYSRYIDMRCRLYQRKVSLVKHQARAMKADIIRLLLV